MTVDYINMFGKKTEVLFDYIELMYYFCGVVNF